MYKKTLIRKNPKVYHKYEKIGEIFEIYESVFEDINDVFDYGFMINENDLNNLTITEVKEIGIFLFKEYNNINISNNDGYVIKVYNSGIRESLEKVYNNESQRNMLFIHYVIIINLVTLIKNSTLVSQADETKGRKKYYLWNYYYVGIKYNNEFYSVIFDIVSMDSGENHYRLQRIEKKKTNGHDGDGINTILPPYDSFVSYNNYDTTND